MKKYFLIIISLIMFSINSLAQNDTLSNIYQISLNQAIEIGYKNNLTIKNSRLEIRKAKWKIWETTAIGLPQVNGQVQFQDFLEIPTQLMPNFLLPVVFNVNTNYFGLRPIQQPNFGNNKIAVQFGSQYNTSLGLTVSQLIFNGEYIVGLKASKTFKALSEQNYLKTQLEIKNGIEKGYMMCLITEQLEKVLQENYQNINKLLKQTQELVNEKMAEQTKVDQIKIIQLTIENQLNTVKRQKQLAYMMLKFQLGLNLTDSLILTDSLENFLENSNINAKILTDFSPEQNINYKIALTREKLALLDMRRAEAKFLPSITGIFNYSTKEMSDDFDIFDKNANWYKSSMIGISVAIPIFGSGQKIAIRQQKRIALEEAHNTTEMLRKQLNIQYEQAKNKYLDAYGKYINTKQNLALSKKIYQDTEIKFKNGTASSFELTQAENQLLQKQAAYYQAIMELLNTKFDLLKLVNQ